MIRLSMEQEAAVDLSSDRSERITSVTGGAGTGKTTIMRKVYENLAHAYNKKDIALAAPTGRAAKRIQEATGIRATTLHRLLKFPEPFTVLGEEDDPNEPLHNADNPLEERVVIVDEASMIGPTLYRQLMNACRGSTLLRFFGDNNQLAPVEEGKAPFIDLLRTKPSVVLTLNFRSNDALIDNAYRVLAGRIPLRNSRFEIIYSHDPLRRLLEFVKDATEFKGLSHQIIMPTRNGKFGTERVNPSLQMRFNPRGELLLLPRHDADRAKLPVRTGDKALWVKNDYHLNLFNGEIGHILDVDREHGSLQYETPDNVVDIPPYYKAWSSMHGSVVARDPRKNIELGYAITTHKAQGSEFDVVVYCITKGQGWLLNRRNLYTAITRARDHVIIVADTNAMSMAIKKGRDK